VVTATVEVPEPTAGEQYAWDVAWADAVREASRLGADERTARALAAGAGAAVARGTRVVVAAHGQVMLAWWLPPGTATGSVRVGPLPHLGEVAAAAARRPAHLILLADRDEAAVIAHGAGDPSPGRRFPVGARPGAPRDRHPERPPAQRHGERHTTGSEPGSGGQRNAGFIAARVAEAAADVDAHIVLGAGDQHILDAVSGHLPGSLGPVTTIASGRVAEISEDRLTAASSSALDEITGAAIGAVADLVASSTEGPDSAAVRGVAAVADQLAARQVAVLLVAAGLSADGDVGPGYRIGSDPTGLLTADFGEGTPVPLDDGLVWAALHQDAIVAQLPERPSPLAGDSAAALLRRGQ
jgi:hypothetical protein